jgi:Domain of unknown function (DUF1929)
VGVQVDHRASVWRGLDDRTAAVRWGHRYRCMMGTDRRGTAAVMLALALAMAVSDRAVAHDDVVGAEEALLGTEHAEEHAAQREALQRWLELPVAERRRQARAAQRSASAAAATIAAALPAADQVGRWETQQFELPTYAINTVVMPTGEVLFWGRAPVRSGGGPNDRDNVTKVGVWNPRTGALDEIPAPITDVDGDGDLDHVALFCSGQSLLPSGEVLLAGGTLRYPDPPTYADFAGLETIFTFDPWTRRWTEQPRMAFGRWYPTQVELADGRTAIVAGYNEEGQGEWNGQMEVFSPGARGGLGTLTQSIAGETTIGDTNPVGTYPHMFVLPGGSVLLVGHDMRADQARTALVDPAKLGAPDKESAWTQLDPLPWFAKASQAAVILGDRGSTPYVTVLGGYEREAPQVAVNWVDSIAAGQRSWSASPIPDQNVARAYANLVELPDGTLLTVGGGAGNDGAAGQNYTGGDPRLKRVELFRPGVDPSWVLGPAQQKWRAYHSTAVLLPDGRVFSAGDDYWDVGVTPNPTEATDDAEIYTPPYLFDGDRLLSPDERPAITSLRSGATGYGQRVAVGVANRQATEAVLVAPAATTHGVNMNQRRVELEVLSSEPGRLDVRTPGSADLAPPGWYMLFVMDAAGTPSEAGWVWLQPGGGGDPAPPPASTPAVDRTAPRLRVRVLRSSPRRLVVRVSASEPVTATLRGRARRRPLAARKVKLARAGAPRTVRLRLPKAATRVLRDGRAVALKLRVEARDAAGNKAARRVTKRLRTR